jgi:murein DD-endopeptidase MepM/ murein hydrolase activator NlpD
VNKKQFNFFSIFLFLFVLGSCTTSFSHQKSTNSQDSIDENILAESSREKKDGIPTQTLSFVWPIDGKPRVASFFGWRKKGERKKGERMHEGLDLGGRHGDNIYASCDGRVVDVAFVKGYGKTVVVYHGGGWSSLYAHLSKYKVKRGQVLKAGDVLGLMGRTGRAQANHLHFEIRKGSDPLDPLLFLPSRELEKYVPNGFFQD